LERHRAARLLLKDRIGRGQKVLHAAPEEIMIAWLIQKSCEYLNFDLYNPAMRRMDITKLDLPDRSKTLIWCSHVMEHIPDDMQALSELYRVLEPGGLLVIQVPIGGDVTYEDPTVTSAEDRLREFLQEDHVRLYGRDLRVRIERAGFECELLTTADASPSDQALYGVAHPIYREVFLARRPENS
jgi:SAM-dependent methyltransferase